MNTMVEVLKHSLFFRVIRLDSEALPLDTLEGTERDAPLAVKSTSNLRRRNHTRWDLRQGLLLFLLDNERFTSGYRFPKLVASFLVDRLLILLIARLFASRNNSCQPHKLALALSLLVQLGQLLFITVVLEELVVPLLISAFVAFVDL